MIHYNGNKEGDYVLNILIAECNIEFAVKLMNNINNINKNVRVCSITCNVKKTLDILNSENNIDIILFSSKIFYYVKKFILNKMTNKSKFDKLSGSLPGKSGDNYKPISYIIINNNTDIDQTIDKINKYIKYKDLKKNEEIYKKKIINELLYLGYDISHKGTQYLIKTIGYFLFNPNVSIDRLEKNIYPKIAEVYNDSVHNIKCRINSSTNAMYCNCDINKLKNYFYFNIDTKPKIKTVINTILYKIN